MGPAKKFIDMLEEQGLLDDDIIAELRRQVAESRTRMTPEIIAKLLVDNEQLTRFQATKLVAKIKDVDTAESPLSARSDGATPPLQSSNLVPKKESDDLGLAPESVSEAKPLADPNSQAAILFDDTDEVDVVDVGGEFVESEIVEVEAVEAIDEEIRRPTRPKKPKTESSKKSRIPKGTSGSKNQASNASAANASAANGPEKNPWDSFRVWGMMIVLGVLLIPFIGIGLWLWKGNADDLLEKAKIAYEGQDYEASVEKYGQFVKSFPTDGNASLARVKVALSKIRKDTKGSVDPTKALTTVKEVLPTIASEKALGGERNDLAGAMLQLAEKFNQKSDVEKGTEVKKKLVESLDELLELCKNPVYVGSAERNQYDDRIKRIEEDRARIVRDITRTDDLALALSGMRQAIESKDVTKAYSVRRDLVRKHVQLETESQLLDLLKEATKVQQSLVTAGKNPPRGIEKEQPKIQSRTAVLANRRDGAGAKPVPGSLVRRSKQSVYGLDASNGSVRWRQFIGAELTTEPKQFGNDGNGDALVSSLPSGTLLCLNAESGETKWRVSFGGPINEPTLDREEVFVTCQDGGVYCLDSETGQAKWGKQVPQRIETSVGLATGKPTIYVVGNHSNLYAMSRKDGSCSEVHYLGHQPGGIRVPPTIVLGHLLASENTGPGTSAIRIQSIADDGLKIQATQPSMMLKGHIVIAPEVDGRSVAVTTDLGEIIILEIEPSKTSNRVSRMTGRITNEMQPKMAWPLLSKSDLWVTGSNLTRYQIVSTKQTLEAAWVKDDQDAFIGRPKRWGTHVIHSRVLRGTMGVRVSAIDGTSGDVAWEVDLGVPIGWVQPSETVFPIQAVSTQAALYAIDKDGFSGKGASNVIENAGRNDRSLLFRSPFKLADGRVVMPNQATNNQWSVWQGNAPAGNRLRRVVLALEGATFGADSIAIGSNVLTATSNGQLNVFDPASGAKKASPFIPSLQPDQKHSWIGPTLASDRKTIFIADTTRRIYRIGVENQQLRPLSEKDFDKTLKGRLVSVGQNLFVIAKESDESIEVLSETDLQSVASIPIQGHIAWGPIAVGNYALVFSDTEGMIAIESNGTKRWQTPMTGLIPIGEPIEVEGDLILATTTGTLLRLDVLSGKLKGKLPIGEKIGGSPVFLAGSLIVPGDEGVVTIVKASDFTAEVAL